MGGKDSTVTNQTAPPPEVMAAYKSLISRAQGVANTPYKPYTGDLVAPINSTQQQAFGAVNNLQNVQNPYLQQAQNYMNQSTGNIWNQAPQVNAQSINSFMSPYQQDVINATIGNINETNAQQQNQLQGNAIAQGAWGGDRAGVAAAELARQQGLAANQTLANLNNQNYSQALSAAQQQQQAGINATEAQQALQAQAGFGLASLGSQALQGQLAGANALLQTGGLQQQQQQNQLNTQYQQWLNQQQYPFQTTQWLGNLVEGLGAGMGGSSSTTTPGPSGLSQAAGAVSTIAPLLMMAFAKDGGAIKGYDSGGSVQDNSDVQGPSLATLLGNFQKQQATSQSQASPLAQAVTSGWGPQFVAPPTPVLGPGANLAQMRSYASGGSTDDDDPTNDLNKKLLLAKPTQLESVVPPAGVVSIHSTLPQPPPPPPKDDKQGGLGGMPDPMSMMSMLGGAGGMMGGSSAAGAGSFLDAGTAMDGMAAFAKDGGRIGYADGGNTGPYNMSIPLTTRPVTMQSIVPLVNQVNSVSGGAKLPDPPSATPATSKPAAGGLSSLDPATMQKLADSIKSSGQQPGALGRAQGFGDGPTDKVWVTPQVNASAADVVGNNLSNLYGAQGGNTGAGADFMSWLGNLFKDGGGVKKFADGGGDTDQEELFSGQPVQLSSIVPQSQGRELQPGATLPKPPDPLQSSGGGDDQIAAGGSGGGSGGGGSPSSLGYGDSWVDKYAANPLTQFGLATLAGTSPFAGVNIGRGGLAALQAVQNQRQNEVAMERSKAELEQQQQAAEWGRIRLGMARAALGGNHADAATQLSNEADSAAQSLNSTTAPAPDGTPNPVATAPASPSSAGPAAQSQAPWWGQNPGARPMFDVGDLGRQAQTFALMPGMEGYAKELLSLGEKFGGDTYLGVDGRMYMRPGVLQNKAAMTATTAAAEMPYKIQENMAYPRVVNPGAGDILVAGGKPINLDQSAGAPPKPQVSDDPLIQGIEGGGHGNYGVPQNPMQMASQKDYAGQLEKRSEIFMQNADDANKSNALFDQMRQESQGFRMGKWADLEGTARAMMNGLNGILGQTDPDTDKKLADYQSFSKNAMELVRATTRATSSRAAVQEMQIIQKALPAAEMSKGGFNQIADQYQGLNDYLIARNNAAQKWRQSNNGTLDGFEAAWNKSAAPVAFIFRRMSPDDRKVVAARLAKTSDGKRTLQHIRDSAQTINQLGLWAD